MKTARKNFQTTFILVPNVVDRLHAPRITPRRPPVHVCDGGKMSKMAPIVYQHLLSVEIIVQIVSVIYLRTLLMSRAM